MKVSSHRTIVPIAALLLLLPARSVHGRDLTFEERVRAQEAIERVYYSHQIGATRPFEEAVPRELLERKVRSYLKQSVALESFWRTPVTARSLERELERIAAGTRFPERLDDIYSALGRDPFLIQECLARPVLVDRLSRNFFSFDERIHGGSREEAEDIRRRLLLRTLDAGSEHPRREVLELVQVSPGGNGKDPSLTRRGPPHAADHPGRRLELGADELRRWRAQAPEGVGGIGPVLEERGAFVVTVILEDGADRVRLGIYRVPKTTWNDWWIAHEHRFDEARVRAVASVHGPLPIPRQSQDLANRVKDASGSCVPDDTWDNGVLDDMPVGRSGHTTVWTGNQMIVWGGGYSGGLLIAGGRYDPVLDTWTLTSTVGAPEGREDHTAVWTGSEMIVWGGLGNSGGGLETGGRYDPTSDTWKPTNVLTAPDGRYFHTAVWTGQEMIVWGGTVGGVLINSGSRYNPVTDTWTSTSTIGAPAPRYFHTAVWTGSRMIVWGGWNPSNVALNTGGIYDPGANTWTSTSLTNASEARGFHSAVWIGTEMIVWGGLVQFGPNLNTGGRFNPVSNSWSPTSTLGVPEARNSHAAVWTGSEMIIWGGHVSIGSANQPLRSGGRYDPMTDTWVPTSMTNAPSARAAPAVWTGSLMIVWGETGNTGGRYAPATDAWTPTSTLNAPSASGHTAVWTGTVMIVWHGGGVSGGDLGGGRYDPLTDSWSPTSSLNAASARLGHTAVWTGDVMIVWGGSDFSATYLRTGGRYDPIVDTWAPTSTVNAPRARCCHSAVWAGSEMIVWGGVDNSSTYLNTGGRYDPTSNSWVPTSTIGAPSPRAGHTAVWTGGEMIIWGGNTPTTVGDGSRYDPVQDRWTQTSMTDAPSARSLHTATWTGSLMIVWGGSPNYLNSGARYDPASDTWTGTSTLGAPEGRYLHDAVWTQREMIVWGGSPASVTLSNNTGGRYDPGTDRWTPTSTVNAPVYGDSGHTVVWTGSFMIVWNLGFGGRYALGHSVDDDLDGLSECEGDCNDANPEVWHSPAEVVELRVIAASPLGLAWDDQRALVGPETLYDLVSGVLMTPIGGPDIASGSCLQSSAATSFTDVRPDPSPGGGFWYLVRARNSCGFGTYGTPHRDSTIPPCP